jgi:aminomethyltransferase
MLKRTPLYEQHVKLGAKMVEFAGWEMPVSYKSIVEEHHTVRNSVGIFDVGHMGLINVAGEDALPVIQKTTTNDASKLSLHQCQYSIICNEAGGTVDDVLVYNLPMYYLVISNAVNTEKVLPWLNRHAQNLRHATVSLYENYCVLSVQGPNSRKIVAQVLNAPISDLKHNHALWWKDIVISKTGYTGEDGFELIISKKEVGKVWDAFIETGVQPCGLGARDTLRLEAGFPLYGHEYDEETSPLEVGYSWAVKFDKGDFIGREALLKQKETGPAKKLVGIEAEGRAIPRGGDSIFDISPPQAEKLVGKVTSGTFSPTLKKPIALAYLAAEQAVLGNEVKVEIRGSKIPAKVVAKTFYTR